MNQKYSITCFLLLGLVFNIIAQKINYDDPKEQERIVTSYLKSSVGIGYAYDKEGKKKPAGYKETMEMFDNKGFLSQYIIYENNEIKERWAFNYDKSGLKTMALCYNGKEELIEKYSIEYKGKNPVLKKGTKRGKTYEVSYQYQGNKLIQERKTVEGAEVYKEIYTYDANGLNIKKEYHKNELIVKTEFVYNQKKQLISEKLYANEVLDHYIDYEYNDKGQKVKENKSDGKGTKLTSYTYTYTSAGNIQKIALYDHQLGYEECSWIYTYDGNGSVDKIMSYSSKKDTKTNHLPVYVKEHTYRYFPKPEAKK